MSRLCATSASGPGELLHVDTKRLNRFWQVGKRILGDGKKRSPGAGWQFLHVAIDDHTRLAYAEVLPAEDGKICAAFLTRALAWYRDQGIQVERVLTDNAGAYRSRPWRTVCARNQLRRRFTRPYRPQTNGKAEALIKTLTREWAYRFAYPTSTHRAKSPPQLPPLVQPTTSTQLPRRPTTNQPRLRPLWSVQVDD